MSLKTKSLQKPKKMVEDDDDDIPYSEDPLLTTDQPTVTTTTSTQSEPKESTSNKNGESKKEEQKKKDSEKDTRITKSKRSGLVFGVGRISNLLGRHARGVDVCVTSVIQDLYELFLEWTVVKTVRSENYGNSGKNFEISYTNVIDAQKTFQPFIDLGYDPTRANTIMSGLVINVLKSEDFNYNIDVYSTLVKRNKKSVIPSSSSINKWHMTKQQELIYKPCLDFSSIYTKLHNSSKEEDELDLLDVKRRKTTSSLATKQKNRKTIASEKKQEENEKRDEQLAEGDKTKKGGKNTGETSNETSKKDDEVEKEPTKGDNSKKRKRKKRTRSKNDLTSSNPVSNDETSEKSKKMRKD